MNHSALYSLPAQVPHKVTRVKFLSMWFEYIYIYILFLWRRSPKGKQTKRSKNIWTCLGIYIVQILSSTTFADMSAIFFRWCWRHVNNRCAKRGMLGTSISRLFFTMMFRDKSWPPTVTTTSPTAIANLNCSPLFPFSLNTHMHM